MAFDGFAVAALRKEFQDCLCGGLITKIAQPEPDEILIHIKNRGESVRLLLSANPALPLAYLTEENKPSPMTAPAFCMLLRKHIGSGRITDIQQPDMDRILVFVIEHRNELGDECRKKLILEMMGKYSNLIFTDDEGMILDAVRRVSSHMSSLREVLPGRPYFLPEALEKQNPLTVDKETFLQKITTGNLPLARAVTAAFTGFSTSLAEELVFRAGLDSRKVPDSCTAEELLRLAEEFDRLCRQTEKGEFSFAIYYDQEKPRQFFVTESLMYRDLQRQTYEDISGMLSAFYTQKETASRIRQRSADLRKIVSTALERTSRKLSLQEKQLADTEKMDKYRIWGELINASLYDAQEGSDVLETLNYYTGERVKIPMDKTLTPSQNAQHYYQKYNKMKRTAASVSEQIEETKESLAHLTSIRASLETAQDEADLKDIRDELADFGYAKKTDRKNKKGVRTKSKPLHYLSSDGFDLYVGKNNYQNEDLTFRMAEGNDWWFHVKGAAGSHVILRCGGKEVPDRTFEEAAALAAFYSSLRASEKAEVDYTLRKNLKKPKGNIPGFVVYHTNYSLLAGTDISGIHLVK